VKVNFYPGLPKNWVKARPSLDGFNSLAQSKEFSSSYFIGTKLYKRDRIIA